MNDRFKFRVWDIEDCTYFEPRDFDDLWLNENAELRVGFYSDATQMIEDYTDNVIIEQCTGLKDKNGNPTYENDLIKTANYKTGLPEIYVVKWCDECGIYQLESTQSDQIIDMYRAEKGIICGNIHEQAEQKD